MFICEDMTINRVLLNDCSVFSYLADRNTSCSLYDDMCDALSCPVHYFKH